MSTLPGMGDESTWPPYMGHPNDPRAPDVCECGDCPECIEILIADDPEEAKAKMLRLLDEVRKLNLALGRKQ